MSLFVIGLGRASCKEGRAAMLIDDIIISRWMFYVQQVEEKKLRYGEENRSKKDTIGNDPRHQKDGMNRPQLQKQKRPTPLSACAFASKNKSEHHG